MHKLFCLSLLFCSVAAQAVTLQECYDGAERNYPLVAQYNLLERIEVLSLDNISKAWLPQASLSAKASWQSEVTRLPIDFNRLGLGIETPSMVKDQYGLTLDISQNIWDGGATAASRQSVKAANDVRRKQLDVNIYALRQRVNSLYFGILLADDYLRLNDILQSQLDNTLARVNAGIEHGVANRSDADAVSVEIVKARQQRDVYNNNRLAYIDMLATLTGLQFSVDEVFVTPQYAPATDTVTRPELKLLDARAAEQNAALLSIKSELMPRFSAFVTAGYGRPGLNIFERDFSPYAMVGVRGSWNIGALYTNSNKKQSIASQIKGIETDRDTFLFNTRLDMLGKDREIASWRDQMQYDDEIIRLREAIVKADEAKLNAGTISGTDLTSDINEAHLARQNKALHQTQLLLNSYQRKFITN